ncbi:hypothetical protein V8D89_000965 [Ganoderma adspersum]
MQAFKFGPKLTTITVGPTPPSDHPSAVTFTAPAKTTFAGDFIFPFGFAVSRGAVLPVVDGSDNNCMDGGNSAAAAAADGESENGEVRTSRSNSHTTTKTACPPTSIPAVPSLSRTVTLPLPHPSPTITPTSAGGGASNTSSPDPSSTSTPDHSSTLSPTQSGSSSAPQSASASSTTTSSPSLASTLKLSTSSASSPSSPGISTANLSTPPTPPAATSSLSSLARSTPATALGLSAGAAVGLALGVFAATAVLVAGAVFPFLFLRARRGKRQRRPRGSVDSSTWKLTHSGSKGSRSLRLLSSTSSWSPPDDAEDKHGYGYGYGYGYGALAYPYPRDAADPEKSTSVGDWVARTSVAVEDAGSRTPPLREPDDAAPPHLRSLSATETSISTLRFGPRKSGKRAKDGLDTPREGMRDGTGALQALRDPFADLRSSEIVRMLTTPT